MHHDVDNSAGGDGSLDIPTQPEEIFGNAAQHS
jgi:hypothetical protein